MVKICVLSGDEWVQLNLLDNSVITLEWRSALEGGFDEVLGSSSYTINIPKTLRNRRVFGDAYRPAEDVRGVRLPARVYNNGLTVIADATAILVNARTDSYEIALSWNTGGDEYLRWKSGEYSLQDGFKNTAYRWNYENASIHSDALLFSTVYNAGDLTRVERTANALPMPASNCLALLNGIASQRGIGISVPEEARLLIRNTAVLLTTRNTDGYSLTRGVTGNSIRYASTASSASIVLGMLVPSDCRDTYDADFRPQVQADGKRYYYRTDGKDVMFAFNFSLRRSYDPDSFNPDTAVYIEVKGIKDTTLNTYETSIERIYPSITYPSANEYVATFSGEWTLRAQGYVGFVPYFYGVKDWTVTWEEGETVPRCYAVQGLEDGVQIDGLYPLAPNLPAIKEVEFVKAMAAYAGCFLDLSGGVLTMIPYDDLLGGRLRGAEYHGKVIRGADGSYGEAEFSFGEFAMRNRFSYKESDDNNGFRADGWLTVENESLDPSADDFYEFPLSVTRDDTLIQWELTWEQKDGQWVWSDLSFKSADHKFMGILPQGYGPASSIEYRPRLSFRKDMRWSEILATRYKEYQRVMRKPLVETVSLYLDERELRELDLTRSHYISELGHEYVIITAQWSSGDGLTKMTLLQID